MVAQSFNPSTGKAEAGRFLMSALSIEGVSGQPGLHRETLTQKPKPKPDKQTNKQTKNRYFNSKKGVTYYFKYLYIF